MWLRTKINEKAAPASTKSGEAISLRTKRLNGSNHLWEKNQNDYDDEDEAWGEWYDNGDELYDEST